LVNNASALPLFLSLKTPFSP